MTQEEKELLLKDLCCRLPYGVIVKDRNGVHKLTAGNTEFTDLLYNDKCNIKPYLFPLANITEEQEKEYLNTCNGYCNYCWTEETFDWLHENHIDYRGLIEKGLAIDVIGLNIY